MVLPVLTQYAIKALKIAAMMLMQLLLKRYNMLSNFTNPM